NAAHRSASIKLSDGTITYGNENDKGAPVIFKDVVEGEVRSITSNPTSIISPTTTTGRFNIGSITVEEGQIAIGNNTIINSHTKEVNLTDLRITAGYKYNLSLEFVIPCTEVV